MNFERLIATAHAAGMAAGEAHTPRPMVVGQAASLFGDEIDYSKPTYHVPEGVCGFAWVHLPKATTPLVRWMKANGVGRKNYGPGWTVWVSQFGQSMERKARYADAYAKVLRDAGHDAYPDSRMD